MSDDTMTGSADIDLSEEQKVAMCAEYERIQELSDENCWKWMQIFQKQLMKLYSKVMWQIELTGNIDDVRYWLVLIYSGNDGEYELSHDGELLGVCCATVFYQYVRDELNYDMLMDLNERSIK